jgi:hypothetical protein
LFRVSAALIHCRRCFVTDYWLLISNGLLATSFKALSLPSADYQPAFVIAVVQQIHIGGIDEAT